MTPIRPALVGRTPGEAVPVYIGDGIATKLGTILTPSSAKQKLGVVTDQIVGGLHSDAVSRSLRRSGWAVHTTILPAGESIKSARTVSALHESWFAAGFERYTPIVAVGGGTVGDGVGFAAATFMRGLPLWHIPTTIVGQVDSAIGGKLGINHPRGKNLIGCFYQPSGIVIDPRMLTTLPLREIRAGLAEVLKYGIIADSDLFEHCHSHLAVWAQGGEMIDLQTLRSCVGIKLTVVAEDEFDTGKRHMLNFGHTLGHAFESWGKYRVLRHGEAVSLGMVAASHIAYGRKMLARRTFDRIVDVCRMISPTRRVARFEVRHVTPYLHTDKKRMQGRNLWVLPVRIGRVEVVDNVTDKEISSAIRFTRAWLADSDR